MRIFLLLVLATTARAQALPEGPGKAVVEKMCKPCHGLDNVVRARMTKDRWGTVVDDMISRGATGTDAEIDQVIDYLAAHFGPAKVNVNKAGKADLVTLLGLSATDALAIVEYREQKGSFQNVDDLAKVAGIDRAKIESFKDKIEF